MSVLAVAGLTLASGLTVPEVYSPGEQACWVLEEGERRLGTCWSRYEGELALGGIRGHRFNGRIDLRFETPGGTLAQRAVTDLVTDADGRPLSFEMDFALGDVRSNVRVVFESEGARAVVVQGGKPRELEPEVPEGAFLLANNFLSHLELLLALHGPPPGETLTFPMFSANTLQGFSLEVSADAVAEGSETRVLRDSLGEVSHLSADGRLMRVEIPAQRIVIRRVDELPEPFTLPPIERREVPRDFEREAVRILAGDVELAGEITRPGGAEGPLPAVFFVSGSGGQDRDGYAGGVDLGTHEILDRLTREGFCVLRVDDRGTGESTGSLAGATFDDLVADARHCVEFLKERSEVDPARVAVIGHSEGGQTAPILATELDLAAIVLMAAPGRPLQELLREQLLAAAAREPSSAEEHAAFERALDDFLAGLEGDAPIDPIDPSDIDETLRPFLPAIDWLRSHAAQRPLANLARVQCPVLILQGGRDIQVSVERDSEPLERSLDAAGHEDHERVVFPELDHLFKRATENPSGLDYLESRPVDQTFLDTLAGWLSTRLGK